MSAGVVFLLVALVLPIAALISRRMPARRWVPWALVWAAIFVAGYLVSTWWYA